MWYIADMYLLLITKSVILIIIVAIIYREFVSSNKIIPEPSIVDSYLLLTTKNKTVIFIPNLMRQ